MVPFDISAIASELNSRAETRPIGRLQDIRKNLKRFARRPGSVIFSAQTTHEEWAFHHGGRAELQFNIGKDPGQYGGSTSIRYGIALSFETSQTLPNLDVLTRKLPLFDEFLRLYSEEFSGLRMWHHEKGVQPVEHAPGPVDRRLARNGVFIFLGKHMPAEDLEYEEILDTFDGLLPLYAYVESNGDRQPKLVPDDSGFAFVPGCPPKQSRTKATLINREFDVALRHNDLQFSLHSGLAKRFGELNVGVEIRSGCGTRIDVVARDRDDYTFFEIKTDHSARGCIREAIGQLLEYSFWTGSHEAHRLVIVGESPLDREAAQYLERLRERFKLPVYYEQVSTRDDTAHHADSEPPSSIPDVAAGTKSNP